MTFFSTLVLFNGLVKIDVHSHKFIRLARSAKLANLSFLKDFTFFKDHNSSSLFSHVLSSRACFSSQNLLLFLNQGLSAKELTLLRFNLKNLGISFTHIPTRFWSNSFVRFGFSGFSGARVSSRLSVNRVNKSSIESSRGSSSGISRLSASESIGGVCASGEVNSFSSSFKNSLSPFCSPSSSSLKYSRLQKSFKKTIYGNVLAFYLSKDFSPSDSIYSLYQFLQNHFIHQHSLSSPHSYFVHNKDLLNFFSTDSDTQSFVGFSRLTLPWDLFSSRVVDDISGFSDLAPFMLSSWFQESSDDFSLNHVNLLFTYLKNYRLIYAGFVNSKSFGSSSLFFDNFDLLTNKFSFSSPLYANFNFYKDNTFFCFEPFSFHPFNKLYLSFL